MLGVEQSCQSQCSLAGQAGQLRFPILQLFDFPVLEHSFFSQVRTLWFADCLRNRRYSPRLVWAALSLDGTSKHS